MLTLTRKVGQKIRIGDDIEIVVREIRGRQVRLGISAPQGLAVYREELYQQIKKEGLREGSSVGGRAAKGPKDDAAATDEDED
ncbi:MAG: carbon storage regulator CsrA [Myxococcales bacterium]|nr:carbon storage regulator CsrA [Myxococcales bacterium]